MIFKRKKLENEMNLQQSLLNDKCENDNYNDTNDDAKAIVNSKGSISSTVHDQSEGDAITTNKPDARKSVT